MADLKYYDVILSPAVTEKSMNYMSDAEGTKAMFRKERLSRKAFYGKLSAGKRFFEAKSEDYFVDDDQNDENA